ncbi:MAG TPA: serine/threonine-protein kinase [Thermoanaerobaculia bacterium]|nr:serine/threonine-protein kinase [Thermoanaerobaculia bacterium]
MIHPGDHIGHVRVEGPLASGGMGAVYVGFDEKLERPVALKAIRSDRLDTAARVRFLNEARLLSQLDHPNVCRIHGYLESEEGDFLVLELIRGRTLREALKQGSDPAGKLAVAEGVARALEAAHQKGIIHRDLKPENVMLTDDGQVKVLDFGLARSEAVEDPEPSDWMASGSWWRPSVAGRTERGDLLGTPTSMSPEQARGENATAASDAYALGLLLQELFTGQPPYEPGLSESLLLVKVADGDTLPVRGIDPDLASLIKRLEAVAPEARPTVAEAAERLAWIRGKPRRRRLRLLAAAVVAAFLLGGVKYTLDLREARRAAEQEAVRAEAAARFLEELFKASDPRQARGRLPDARELLIRGTERLKQDKDLASQPLLRARLLDTLGVIHTNLGLYDEARPLLDEALALRTRLRGGEHSETAETLVHLGALAQRSGKGDAVALLRRALAIREARLGPESPEVAGVLDNLGMTLASKGHLDEAEEILKRSLVLHERLWGKADPRVAKVLHNLSGIAYYRGRTEEGIELQRRALAIREATLPDDDPDLAGSREALALFLQKQGKLAETEELLKRVAETAEKVYGPEHPELARTLFNLGLVCDETGKHPAARRLLERALAIREKTLEPGNSQLLQAREILAKHCREGHGLNDAESRELCRQHGM